MPAASAIRIDLGGASVAAPHVDAVCELYDAVFSRPPFHWRDDESQLHRERLGRLLDDTSFSVALAWAGARLTGFAYGYTLPPDTKRWTSLIEPVDRALATEWPGRTFVLFDFAVELASRGVGVGRQLHDDLLGSRHEERATLTVQPTALKTKSIYVRWGWSRVGQIEGGPTGAAPVFDVYLRPALTDLRRSEQVIGN